MGSKYFLAYIGRTHIKSHIALVAISMSTLLEVVEGIDAILRLVLSRLWLATHPLKLGAKQVTRLLHLHILCLDALSTLLKIVVVVAVVGKYFLLVELHDACANVVEEVAIVSYHEQSHGATPQVIL